jgi:hypothetical protein
MVNSASSLVRAAAIAGAFLGATAILVWLVQPLRVGPAASDAASSVLYFDRIVSGRHLEAWLNTTPKPLLTVVYGVLHSIDREWRLVSTATILATVVGVVLGAEAVRRVAGIAAASFAAVALTGSVSLATEASWAYGLPWAFALWMAAAVVLLRDRPRYGLAGGFLGLAALARPETFVLLGIATLILAGAAVRGKLPSRGAWLIMVGWLAIPGMCLHDLLLTGDPFWWLSVAPHAVEVNGGRARSLAGTIYMSGTRLIPMMVLVLEALVGGVIVLRRRAWVATAGLVGMGPLVIVFTWLLAARHIETLPHYLHAADLATILGAAIGVGILLALARGRLEPSVRKVAGPVGSALVVVVAIALAVVSSGPFSPLDARARRSIALEAKLDGRVALLLPIIASNVNLKPGRSAFPPGPQGSPDPAAVALFVPRHRLPRMAVDLDLPLTSIAVLVPTLVDLARGYPSIDSVVYMDGVVDPASIGTPTAVLRVTTATTVGRVRIVPLKTDPAAGIWIVRLEAVP